jgi:hypothetical protein
MTGLDVTLGAHCRQSPVLTPTCGAIAAFVGRQAIV